MSYFPFFFIFTFRLVIVCTEVCTYTRDCTKIHWKHPKLGNVTIIWMLSVKDGLSYHMEMSVEGVCVYVLWIHITLRYFSSSPVTDTSTCDLNGKIIAKSRWRWLVDCSSGIQKLFIELIWILIVSNVFIRKK